MAAVIPTIRFFSRSCALRRHFIATLVVVGSVMGAVIPAEGQVFTPRDRANAGLRGAIGDGFAVSTEVRRSGQRQNTGGARTRNTGDRDQAPEEVLPVGARRIIRDGDLSFPTEPEAQQDGVLSVPEPVLVQDGIDSTRYDTRPPEDYSPFESPPAGYDPDQFTIPSADNAPSDLNPTETRTGRSILNDRTQLFEDDPYQPLGIRVGSFLLFPEIEIAGDYLSNVFSSPDKFSDVAIDILPSGRLTSNWSRHALEFRANGNFTRFSDFSSENETGYLLESRGRLDVTSRSNVEAAVSRNLSQESRNAINATNTAVGGNGIINPATAFGELTDVLTDEFTVTGNQRFNRLRLRLSAAFQQEDFDPTTQAVTNNQPATFVSIDDRDSKTTEQTLRASWEFKPTFSVFGEAAINQRDAEVALVADGIERDSDGQSYRVGIDFGNTGAYLRGSISLGYGIQNLDSAQLDNVDGILIDADLEYRATELTSVLVAANSDITDSTTALSGGVITRTAGIGLRHAFRENIIATTGFVFSLRDFGGVDVQEREFITSLGLEYFMRRGVSLFADYDHTIFKSDFADSDFINDEIRVGMRLSR